jgi:hypothetical protein
MIDKSWTKKDLLEIIKIYQIDIEDAKELSKKPLTEELYFQLLNTENAFDWSNEFPEIYSWGELVELLEKAKTNTELDYRQKQEIIHKAKTVLNYCRNGYLLANTEYQSYDDLYIVAMMVSQHCDISTCRRAIMEFNKDQKLRNKIEPKISQKMQKMLEQKKINKQELIPKLIIKKEPIRITFD